MPVNDMRTGDSNIPYQGNIRGQAIMTYDEVNSQPIFKPSQYQEAIDNVPYNIRLLVDVGPPNLGTTTTFTATNFAGYIILSPFYSRKHVSSSTVEAVVVQTYL